MSRPSSTLAAGLQVPTALIPAVLYPVNTPPGPDVDLTADQAPRIIAVSAALMAISGLIVSLRFTARYLSTAGIWWDDWLCLAAMLVAWGCCVLGFIVTQHNFGKHEAAQPLPEAIENTVYFFKILYTYEHLYTLAITLAKSSIIIFYGRIFTERKFRMALWTVSGMVITWFLAVEITQFLQCRPLSALWDGTYAQKCIDIIQFFLAVGAINCLFNFILLVMPLPMIWGLEIGTRAKIGLSMTFMLGIFVLVVSIVRLVILREVQNVDVTWSYVDAAIWTTTEPIIAVCSASLPILRSLWVLLRPSHSAQNSAARMRTDGSKRYEKQVNFIDTPKTIDHVSPHHNRHTGHYGAWSDSEGEIAAHAPSPLSKASKDEESTIDQHDLAALTALEIPRAHIVRSRRSDILSPVSELSAPSNVTTRAPTVDRNQSLISKFSNSAARGEITRARSPRSDRSDSPQTIEMNRLPIQGGLYELGEDEKVQEEQEGHQQNATQLSSTTTDQDHPMQPPHTRFNGQQRNIHAVELDARENRRWSLRKGR